MLSPADRALVRRDEGLPGLATVLDPVASAQAVVAAMPDAGIGPATVYYVRYKAGVSCLTGVAIATDAGVERYTLKALPFGAGDKWQNAARDRRAVVDIGQRIVFRRFPQDGTLRGPRWLFDPATREGALERLGLPGCALDVIAYKPERRLVACALAEGRPVAVVKCYESTGYERALAARHALAGSPGLATVPATAWHDRRRTIVTPWVQGRVLQVGTDPLEYFAQVGQELARLHAASIQVAPRGGAVEQASLAHLTSDVARWVPDETMSVHRLVARLAGLWEEGAASVVPIHGDFYSRQVLVHDEGITFLDFDECTMGDPHADLALFAAHIERDVVRGDCSRVRADDVMDALLSGYRTRRHLDPARLIRRTAEAILRLTPHPFRHRCSDWPGLTRQLIARAGALLDGLPSERWYRRGPAPGEAGLRTDASLAFSATLLDPAAATEALRGRDADDGVEDVKVTGATLLRHKPGRRCLIRFDVRGEGGTERWLGKVRARGTPARAAWVHRALWNAGARNIPEPLGTVAEFRMALQRAVPGVDCLAALRRGDDAIAVADAVAASLHTLHQLPVSPGRAWMLDDELALLRDRLGALRDREASHQATLARLLRRLVDVAAPLRHRAFRAVIHRDFYHDQVLLHASRCTLVDLDLVAIGDPALDVGNFVGHLVELSWREGADVAATASLARRLITATAKLAPDAVTEDAVTRYACLTVGRLLEIATHHDARRHHLPILIATLDACLARAGRRLDLSLLTEPSPCHVA